MKSKSKRSQAEKGAFEIIEEIFHLLRTVPPSVLATYYFGALPFIGGLLYFWTDMSRSAFAYENLAPGAFMLAILFVWMKTWQAIYTCRLRGYVCNEPPRRWTIARIARTTLRQTIIQPSGLFLLPLALLMTVPFGWTYALYQNMIVLDDGGKRTIGSLFREATHLARLWQKQNHILIWALSPYLMVTAAVLFLLIMPVVSALTPDWTAALLGFYSFFFMLAVMPLSPVGIAVAANIASAMFLLPQLLKVFFGIQTIFVKSPATMFDSTFFAVICGLTYLCMDPLMKAAYVLRCFYGQSLRTGEDLRVDLKRLAHKRATITLLCVLSLGFLFCGTSEADPPPLEGTRLIVSPAELDLALDQELEGRQYAWRMPRIPRSEMEEGLFAAFMRGIGETLRDWVRTARKWARKILKWIGDQMPDFEIGGRRKLSEISDALRVILYLILAALVCVAGVLLWRLWKQGGNYSSEVIAKVIDASPDIEDEDTTADELPGDRWLAMANDLIEKGELRLALRAAFLASLAHLGERGLVSIARFKSNQDYRHELGRRAHAEPEVLDTFSQSAAIYESIWYGVHDVTREMISRVMTNQERLRACGQQE